MKRGKNIRIIFLFFWVFSSMAEEEADMSFTPEETVGKEEGMALEGPPSEVFIKGLQLYKKRKYRAAAVHLHRVVSGETQDAVNNVQKAEFYLGKALYHLKFYQGSLSMFMKVVEAGASHAYFDPTLKWLAQLSRELPEPAGIIEQVGFYPRSAIESAVAGADPEMRNELFYLLGRFKYSKAEFSEAIDLFRAVDPDSKFYIKAKFFEGITYVRDRRAQPALEAFKEILEAIDRGVEVEDEDRYRELAQLSLARIYYSTSHWASAIEMWDRIPPVSEYWLDSLFEKSWAFFQVSEYDRALGNIHSLNSPFFENYFYPESLVLKAVIYFYNCHYEEADKIVDEFLEIYEPTKRELERYMLRFKDAESYYRFLVQLVEGEVSLPPRIRKVIEIALGDRMLLRHLEYIRVLAEEKRRLDKSPPQFRNTGVGGMILQNITLARSLAVSSVGDLAKSRYQRAIDELHELITQALAIKVEVTKALRGIVLKEIEEEMEIRGPEYKAKKIKPDPEHRIWPFEGEYWRDELGYYRQPITYKCGR